MFSIEPVTLAFDLFLICSGLAVLTWMIHEYRQTCENGFQPNGSTTATVMKDSERAIVPLAVCERPCETHSARGELNYRAVATSRARHAARPAGARSTRGVSGRASALRFEHRG